MKKLIAVNACLLILMFMTAGMVSKPDTDRSAAEKLISERIIILNEYYSGETEAEEAERRLELIESGSLLREDRAMMKEFAKTDVERVPEHQVEITECETMQCGIVKGTAEISYRLEGVRGSSRQSAKYYFTGDKDEGEIKLTQLKKI